MSDSGCRTQSPFVHAPIEVVWFPPPWWGTGSRALQHPPPTLPHKGLSGVGRFVSRCPSGGGTTDFQGLREKPTPKSPPGGREKEGRPYTDQGKVLKMGSPFRFVTLVKNPRNGRRTSHEHASPGRPGHANRF